MSEKASEFKFLKSETAYRRWAGKTFARRPYMGDRYDLDRWRTTMRAYAPESYPCIGVLVVQSFGYEEERPAYLYPRDAAKLLKMDGSGWRSI